ncbi:hypothetical protein [uncultured Chryseobacterium sp.]|uniref:hypothetical protein n=1 Tax=uncultured Chryseobacterium sp. TaxID=259322 RepID=UPI0025DB3616|nr:hypothetical protein [uncultured Chryseobacterium sp.]
MLDVRHNKYPFYRSFLRKVLMGLMLLPGILGAQEIYDPGNSLYVKPGTEIHMETSSRETSLPAKKPASAFRKQRKMADMGYGKRRKPAEKRQQKMAAPEKEAQEPAFVYTGKETSHFTSGRQETHIGILAPVQYTSKAAAAALMPHSIARILSAEDFTQHKYLYKESHRHEGISYPNSCRPPPYA